MDRESLRIATDNIGDKLKGTAWQLDTDALAKGRLLLWNDAFTNFGEATDNRPFYRGYWIAVDVPAAPKGLTLTAGWFDMHYPDESISEAEFHRDFSEDVAHRFGLGQFLWNACPPELAQRFVPILREFQNHVGRWQ